MKHPLYQYLSKEARALKVVEIATLPNCGSRTKAYCHAEEKWKPIGCFTFFKVGPRDFVPHAVCTHCLQNHCTLDNLYDKNGNLLMKAKLLRQKQCFISVYETMVNDLAYAIPDLLI